MSSKRPRLLALALVVFSVLCIGWALISAADPAEGEERPCEKANPLKPLPTPPLGIESSLDELEDPPTPETVRLGRWLFYDKRLSADGTISCATCHQPEHAFSELTPVSTGVDGQKGGRKAPSFVNLAWTIFPHFFWDGRAASLDEQAMGPMINPIEMGMASHDLVVERIRKTEEYGHYFEQAFGDPEINIDRVAKAIADYERTRMSGNSPVDRWQAGDAAAVSAEVKLGYELFFDKAQCNQCHFGQNFTDNRFHNVGVGWDAETKQFKDVGRFELSKAEEDIGAFKTPGLREVTKHPPYMHDGSIATLREVVVHYNIGGIANPHLSPKMQPLNLTDDEVGALVAFMEALEGEGYQDVAPEMFPQ
jgi:cytochrome c peroxidase